MPEFRAVTHAIVQPSVDHFVDRPCPLCGSTDRRVVSEYGNFQFFTDDATANKRARITDNQCLHCSTLYRSPCFTDAGFAVLFAEAGRSYGSSAQRPYEQIEWLGARGLLRSGRALLDVGCYDGGFLSRIDASVVRMGVDIDAPAIERGRRRDPDLLLTHGRFESFSVPRSPDVITMFHVLEHLPDPVAVLRRLRSIASAETRLVVEVPVVERGDTNDVNGFFSVQHLTHFSEATLRGVISRSGWEIEEQCAIEGYNGFRVLARPAAERHQVERSPADVLHLRSVLAAWYRAQRDVESRIATLPVSANIALWGAGLHTEVLYQSTSLFQHDARRFLLVDGDPLKQGKTWRGIDIQSPATLAALDWSSTHLVVSSYGGQPSIVDGASAMGIPAERILPLYASVRVY